MIVRKLFFVFVICISVTSSVISQSTLSMEEVRKLHTEKVAMMADLQAQMDVIQSDIDLYQNEMDGLAGWTKGLNGLIGFNITKSGGWVANPNPRASSSALSIDITAFANYNKNKFFVHNKGIITESWQDVDKSDADRAAINDGLFDNGVVDLLNISSLSGYKLTETLALSGLAEFNTSIRNFISPGTFDIGLGLTWIPSRHLTVTLLPINYHVAFSGVNGLATTGSIGAKLRADYFKDFRVYGKDLTWTSTLTSFIPYQDKSSFVYFDPSVMPLPEQSDVSGFTAGLFEYTWLNTVSFELWRGIGVGVGWGLRSSDFEAEKLSDAEITASGCEDCLLSKPGLQTYFNFGLSYAF